MAECCKQLIAEHHGQAREQNLSMFVKRRHWEMAFGRIGTWNWRKPLYDMKELGSVEALRMGRVYETLKWAVMSCENLQRKV